MIRWDLMEQERSSREFQDHYVTVLKFSLLVILRKSYFFVVEPDWSPASLTLLGVLLLFLHSKDSMKF